jgi:hypothetical protein
MGRVIKQITVVKGKFGTRAYGGFSRVAIMHAGVINEIKSILSPRQMKTGQKSLGNDQEGQDRSSEILH